MNSGEMVMVMTCQMALEWNVFQKMNDIFWRRFNKLSLI